MPTAAMWNGDLSNIVDADGRKTIIYDPLTTDGPTESGSLSRKHHPGQPDLCLRQE